MSNNTNNNNTAGNTVPTVTPPTLPRNWKESILTDPKADDYIAQTKATIDDTLKDNGADFITEVAEADDLFFLVKPQGPSSRPLLLHTLRCVRGTRADGGIGTKSYIIHNGLSSRATPFSIEPDNFFQLVPESNRLDYVQLTQATTNEEFEQVAEKDQTTKIADLRNAITVPHFIAKALISNTFQSASDAALLAINAIKSKPLLFPAPDENTAAKDEIFAPYLPGSASTTPPSQKLPSHQPSKVPSSRSPASIFKPKSSAQSHSSQPSPKSSLPSLRTPPSQPTAT